MKTMFKVLSFALAVLMLGGVSVVFAGEKTASFSDVGADDWFYDSVKYVSADGIMQGVSNIRFDPEGKLTRAMAVTILFRISGQPEVTEKNTFSDVPDETWYTEPVSWAQTEGIVKGRTKTEFDPNGEIIRAEFAAMLSRYITYSDMVIREIRGGEPSDIDSVPEYAKEPVRTMYRSGIINGRENGEFDADAQITRCETAALVERYEKKSQPKVIENGVWRDNAVTRGWVINSLYELEGKPDVKDWSPYDGTYEFAIYRPDDPDWVKTHNEREFWGYTVKQKWYYKSLLWARENYLYSALTWKGVWDSEYVERDFEQSVISKDEFIELLFNYCRRVGLELPKVRDYPGFEDVIEDYYNVDAVTALYEAGVVSEKGYGEFGINEIVYYEDAIEVIKRLAELKTVTLGWVINALYILEGEPEVEDWNPFDDGRYHIALYDPHRYDAEKFWLVTVKEKWYYNPLMWAVGNGLYFVVDPLNYSIVDGDFDSYPLDKFTFASLICKYCEKNGIELPKERDYPGFSDLDELENGNIDIITAYEAGLISGTEDGKLDIYGAPVRVAQASRAIALITELD